VRGPREGLRPGPTGGGVTTGSDHFEHIRDWAARRQSLGWWHSFDLPDGSHIEGVNSVEGLRKRLGQFPIPEDLRGKRVLDVGAWDGWFSFEMERRGADVLAIDVWDNPLFHEIHSVLQSRVEYRQMDVYDLSPARVGRFDIVLFMGVLYHLKHPLLALERVCSVTEDLTAVDSFVLKEQQDRRRREPSAPRMEFYETSELGGQTDNWVGPDVACLMAFCRTAGFARVELRSVLPDSACVACYRRWEPWVDRSEPAPQLRAAFHHTTFGINFSSDRDDYVSAKFESDADRLGIDDVRPEVGELGTRPIVVVRVDDGMWQANFKLPPGLSRGWHPVRVRVRNGPRSNDLPVAVDLPPPDGPVAIAAVQDGTTWERDELRLHSGNALTLWVEGLPENADRENVVVLLDGRRLPIAYIAPFDPDGRARQVNAEVPEGVPTGTSELVTRLGGHSSEPSPVRILD
jgi:tRNA (mo5U34)-methyltransferase